MLGGKQLHGAGQSLPDAGKLTASDDGAVDINDADGAAGALFQLEHDTLKYAAGHVYSFLLFKTCFGCIISPNCLLF